MMGTPLYVTFGPKGLILMRSSREGHNRGDLSCITNACFLPGFHVIKVFSSD